MDITGFAKCFCFCCPFTSTMIDFLQIPLAMFSFHNIDNSVISNKFIKPHQIISNLKSTFFFKSDKFFEIIFILCLKKVAVQLMD